MIFSSIIVLSWLAFLLFWIVSAFGVKKNVGALHRPTSEVWIRLAVLMVVVLLVVIGGRGWLSARWIPSSPLIDGLGALFCALGIGLAIWARVHLGRNWSSFPTVKEGHELVTSGPYAVVRHPIYSGLLLAMIGTMLTLGTIWLCIFLSAGVIFVLRVKREETLMLKQFPESYPAYQKRTKALIPFIY